MPGRRHSFDLQKPATFCLIFLVTLMASAAALADDTLRRMTLRQDTLGWEAVGYLDIGGQGFCTGTLIETDVVLTAAHCLIDEHSGERRDPTKIRFLAGWRDGEAIAIRQGVSAVIHESYAARARDVVKRVRYDVALLKLDRPISIAQAAPFSPGAGVTKGDTVSVVSYARGRAKAPSFQRRCQVKERARGILVMSCDVDFGSSGAPVLAIRGGRVRIVSIISSGANTTDGHVTFGMDISQPLADLQAAMRSGRGVYPTRIQPGAKRLKLGASTSGSGAKFLRP